MPIPPPPTAEELDAVSAKSRALPWVRVETDYRFASPEDEVTLGGMFRGRRQLFVYK